MKFEHERKQLAWSLTLSLLILLATTINGFAQTTPTFVDNAADSVTSTWAQFRGPRGSGVTLEEYELPTKFGPTQNVLWKCSIPSGVSSPSLWKDRIFLSGFDENTETLYSICISRKTGKVLWQRPVPALEIEDVYPISSPAACTPVCDDAAVFFYYGSYGIIAYDHSGNKLWSVPLDSPENTYGVSSSPILVDGLLFINHHGNDSALLCLNATNGKLKWSTDRSMHKYGWSTPVLWEQNDHREIIVLGGDFAPGQRLVAYDFETGDELWWIDELPPCGKSTPVIGNGLLFFAVPDIIVEEQHEINNPEKVRDFYAKNHKRLAAVRPGGSGRVNETHIVWEQRLGTPGVPSPLFVEDRLYTFRNGSLGFLRDAATGELLHRARIGNGGFYYSSPVAGDGKVYISSSSGVVSVIEMGDRLNVLSKNDLGEPVLATPAIGGGVLYIRANETLYAFAKSLR